MTKSLLCCDGCEVACKRLQRLTNTLFDGTVEQEEFAYNTFLTLLGLCDICIKGWIKSLEPLTAGYLLEYSVHHFLSVDFMPCPRPLLPAQATDEDVFRKQTALRAKYLVLHNALTDRVWHGRKG